MYMYMSAYRCTFELRQYCLSHDKVNTKQYVTMVEWVWECIVRTENASESSKLYDVPRATSVSENIGKWKTRIRHIMSRVAREFERVHTKRGPQGGARHRDPPAFPPPPKRIRNVTVVVTHVVHEV